MHSFTKRILLFACLTFGYVSNNRAWSQMLDWHAITDVSIQYGAEVADVTMDPNGNILKVGYYSALTDFDPGPGTNIPPLSSGYGGWGMFIQKLSPSGQLVWVKTFNGLGDELKIRSGAAGQVYVSGNRLTWGMDLDPGPGTFVLPSGYNFVLKLDQAGNFSSAFEFYGNGLKIFDMAVFPTGEMAFTGLMEEGTIDFDPTQGTHLATLPNSYGQYICWLNANNSYKKVVLYEYPYLSLRCLTPSPSGELYVGGSSGYSPPIDFDPGPGVSIVPTRHSFVAKFNTSGIFQWQSSSPIVYPGSTATPGVSTLDRDNQGNLYAFDRQGEYWQLRVITSGGVVSKTATIGKGVWVMNVSSEGRIYAAMRLFGPEMDYSFEPGVQLLDSLEGIVIVEFDQDLKPASVISMGNAVITHPLDSPFWLTHLLETPSGDLIIEGTAKFGLDIDPSSASSFLPLSPYNNIYTMKLHCSQANTWTNAQSCGPFTFNGQTYSNPGVYTQTLANVNGCDSVLTLNLQMASQVKATKIRGVYGAYSAFPLMSTYQWVDCANNYAPIPGETDSVFAAISPGTYAVVLTMAGCTDTSDCFIVLPVGIEEEVLHGLKVSTHSFGYTCALEGAFGVTMMDLQGRVLQSVDGSESIQMNMENYAVGVYFLRVQNKGGSENRKVMWPGRTR